MTEKVTYSTNFTIRMDKEMHRRLSFVSKERRLTMAEYVRGLLTQHMDEDAQAVEILRKLIKETPNEVQQNPA